MSAFGFGSLGQTGQIAPGDQPGTDFDWNTFFGALGNVAGPAAQGVLGFQGINANQSSIEAANRANQQRYGQILDITGQTRKYAGQFNQDRITGPGGFREQEASINALYGQAQDTARSQGRQASRDVRDTERQFRAGEQANLTSAGFAQGGVASGLRGQSLAREHRALNDVQESVAGIQTGLITQQAAAQQGMQNALLAFQQQRLAQEASLALQQAGFIERRSDQATTAALGPLFAAAFGGQIGTPGGSGGGDGLSGALGPIGTLAGALIGGPPGAILGGGLGAAAGGIPDLIDSLF